MSQFQSGERIHLVDKKGRQYALTLKAGDRYQLSGHKIAHDELIGKSDGCLVTLSGHKTMLACGITRPRTSNSSMVGAGIEGGMPAPGLFAMEAISSRW